MQPTLAGQQALPLSLDRADSGLRRNGPGDELRPEPIDDLRRFGHLPLSLIDPVRDRHVSEEVVEPNIGEPSAAANSQLRRGQTRVAYFGQFGSQHSEPLVGRRSRLRGLVRLLQLGGEPSALLGESQQRAAARSPDVRRYRSFSSSMAA